MGLRKKMFFVTFLIAISSSCYAQDSISKIVYTKSSDYITSFQNRISTRLFFVNTSNSLTINDRNSNQFFELIPNKQDHIGATISFRSISLSYSFTPDFISENKDNEHSKLFNLQFRTYLGNHWMQSLEMYQEKGFYLKNNIINIYYPSFKSLKIGGATSFIFNRNFSFRAIVSQDEKQIKSAGSFIPRLMYYYTKINLSDDAQGIKNTLHSYDVAIAPAYYYNLVPVKDLLISAGASVGIGLNYSKVNNDNLTSILSELNFRSSISYNFSDLYVGAQYNYLVLDHNTDRSSYINDDITYFEIFIGYRFKAPKKLVQKTDALNKKIHLKK
jgi:hypothetical protein